MPTEPKKEKPQGGKRLPKRPVPGGERKTPPRHCHCVGHRAIFIFGASSNRTIRAALSWTLAQTNVHHKAYYIRASGGRPKIPNAAGNRWVVLRDARGRVGDTADLGAQITDCCFFEEILVMAHGTHPGLNQFLSDKLGQFIQTRPVRKLTVWTCDTATDIYPNARTNRRYYEKICGLLQPKACPCNCDLNLCDGRCHDPDGNTRAGYKCPSVAETSKLYLAAWDDVAVGGRTKHIAAKLGITPGRADGQVFTSPDGRMREVTISADGSTSMTLREGADVFAGIRVREDKGLKHRQPRRARSLNARWRRAAAQALLPTALHAYTGPLATTCRNREGCLPEP